MTQADIDYIERVIPEEAKKQIKKEMERITTGKLKRAKLPNDDTDYDPIDGMEERFGAVSESPLYKKAVEILSRDD